MTEAEGTRAAPPLRATLAEPLEHLRSRPLAPVEVAVIDSGVDATHPDLAGRVVAAFRAEPGAGGVAIVPRPLPANADTFGHGTAVASIVAAVAPNARLVDLQVLHAGNLGTGAALLAAFAHAVERRVPVINMSLAATAEHAPGLFALCERAYRQGQLVVAAKRNMPLVDYGFPAEFSSCISVDAGRMPSPFALGYRGGHPIEYVAHGEEVVAAAAGGGYTTKTGTSFATPAVAGLCALLLGAYPGLRPFEVKAVLKAFASEVADG